MKFELIHPETGEFYVFTHSVPKTHLYLNPHGFAEFIPGQRKPEKLKIGEETRLRHNIRKEEFIVRRVE